MAIFKLLALLSIVMYVFCGCLSVLLKFAESWIFCVDCSPLEKALVPC